jgi:DNA-binding LytR/AlgR family response regulator
LILLADRRRMHTSARIHAQPAEQFPAPLSEGDPTSVSPSDPAPPQQFLRLEAGFGEPPLEIPIADLILLEAADNYCKFHYLKDQQRKVKVLRMQMKVAEASLSNAPGFYRCHRSYLVNGQMIETVLGAAQNYRLKVRHLDEPTPVSRSFDIESLRQV